MSKNLKVAHKARFRALALPLANEAGLRPALASGDYLTCPIHDGTKESIAKARDHFFGNSEERSKFRQWWSFDIALEYPELNPADDAPKNPKIYYMLKFLAPGPMEYRAMRRFVNHVVSDLYKKIGRGEGTLYASIIPSATVERYLLDGTIEKADEDTQYDTGTFDDWTVSYTQELHYVDPATIEVWPEQVEV